MARFGSSLSLLPSTLPDPENSWYGSLNLKRVSHLCVELAARFNPYVSPVLEGNRSLSEVES